MDGLKAQFANYDSWDVLERRFLNPEDPGSLPILLADEDPHACTNSDHQLRLTKNSAVCPVCKKPARKWMVRFVNVAEAGRWAQIKNKGYEPVAIAELRDQQDVAGLVIQKDNWVRLGDRGQEIAVKMPLWAYHEIKKRQRAVRAAQERDRRAQMESIATVARAHPDDGGLGESAASQLADSAIRIETWNEEKTTLGDEARSVLD